MSTKRELMASTVLIKEGIYIPVHMVNVNELKETYTTKRYDDKACKNCQYVADRHSYLCDECPGYLGEIRLYKLKTFRGRSYISIPVGDKRNFERNTGLLFNEIRIKDQRIYAPFDYKIKFLATLRDYQSPVVAEFLKHKYGLLLAPPRTGKCVTGETLVFTEHGMLPIKDLFDPEHPNGDTVPSSLKLLARSGVEPISHLYKKRVDVTLRVTTTNGYTARGTENHPLLVLTPALKLVWRNLEDMQEGDVLCIERTRHLWSQSDVKFGPSLTTHDANAVVPERLPGEMCEKLARLLGYLVANGSLTTAHNTNSKWFSFCTQNKKVQRDFSDLLHALFGYTATFSSATTPVARICSVRIVDFLEQQCRLEFVRSRLKTIPQSVLSSTKPSVTAFLNAYFSCDSYLAQGQAIQLCTASSKLAHQLHVLLLNFGIVSSLKRSRSFARNSKTPKERTYYSIKITSKDKSAFLDTFTLLKRTKITSIVDVGAHDVLPGLGFRLKRVFNRFHVGSGVYSVGGKRFLPKPLYSPCRKGINALPDDLYARDVVKINPDTLELLAPNLGASISKIVGTGYFFDRIVAIKRIEKPVDVYDVAVPGSHSFIANGIVSHNTLMMLYMALQLGQKMLMLANQHEFVEQFLDHIHGNEEEGIPKCTNLPELEQKYGKKLYGTPKTDEDFENFQFFAMTYQAFMSEKNGKDRFNKIRRKIGTLGIDEVDKSAAAGFARVVSMFPSRYRFGVSGTLNRKDGLHFITKAVLGPVVARSTREALKPTVILHDSMVKCNRNFGTGKGAWVRTMQYISKEKARNKLIVEWVMKDLAKGHNIVIPVAFRAHVTLLCNMINDAYGSEICEEFTGGAGAKSKAKRKETLTRAKSGKTRVTVGIRSLLQRGLNVPSWSCLYLILPISNEPNLKQETQRVCTPGENKRSPIIRLFFDKEIGASMGCARNTIKHCQGFKYAFMQSEKQEALKLLVLGAGRGSRSDLTENLDDAQFKSSRSLFDRTTKAPARVPLKRL